MGVVFLIVIIVIAVWVLASCVRIVPQAYAVILERLGAYQATWSTGIHFKVPFIERVARKVNLKEQVVDFPPQPVITKDNVTMQIDTVVFFQITDPKLYTYGVENPIMAIENLSATTLRNIIGDMELDETLTSRETSNTKMRASLDEATDPWGIKVNRVELKNIIPPAAIQDAIEKQMKAERERREAILIAEGQKKSTILVAEGKKQSAILDAEAEKQAAILRAEAQKERMIKEAEGQAEEVLKVQNANAEGIRMIREAGADEAVLTLKSLEALKDMAEGKSKTGVVKKRASKREKKDWIAAYIFIAPVTRGLLAFYIRPFIQNIWFSFNEVSKFNVATFCGLANYQKLFHDGEVLKTFGNTLKYVVVTVPVGMFLSILIAALLNSKIKGTSIYRTLYFLPSVTMAAAVAMVWKWIYNEKMGILNSAIRALGGKGIGWLTDPKIA